MTGVHLSNPAQYDCAEHICSYSGLCASLNSLWWKLERGKGKKFRSNKTIENHAMVMSKNARFWENCWKKPNSLFVCYWIKAKVIGAKKSITQEGISSTVAELEVSKNSHLRCLFFCIWNSVCHFNTLCQCFSPSFDIWKWTFFAISSFTIQEKTNHALFLTLASFFQNNLRPVFNT